MLSPGHRPGRRAAHAEDRRRRHRTRPARPTTSSRSTPSTCRPAGQPPSRPTRSCRSSRAPRSRSTAATRTSSSPNYKLGSSQLQYSTSEIMTERDRSAAGTSPCSTATRAPTARPCCATRRKPDRAGQRRRVEHDVGRGHRRPAAELHAQRPDPGADHGGGTRPLLLLLADKATAETFWRQDTAGRPGAGTRYPPAAHRHEPDRRRHPRAHRRQRHRPEHRGVHAPRARDLERPAACAPTPTRHRQPHRHDPDRRAGHAARADRLEAPARSRPRRSPASTTRAGRSPTRRPPTASPAPGTLPVLYADDYGFHTGNTWYRGRFRGAGGRPASTSSRTPAAARRPSRPGSTASSSAAPPPAARTFTFPAGALQTGGDNVLSVLTVNMGHEEDYNSTNANKAARGLTGASLIGAPLTPITWRLQGVRGGETADRPGARPAVHRRAVRRARRLVVARLPDRAWTTGHPARPATPRRASPGTAPTSRSGPAAAARTPRSA